MRRNAPKAHPEQVPADGKSRKRRAAGNRLRRKTAPGEGHRNRGLGKGKGMKARMKAGAPPYGWERVPPDGRVPELRLGLKRLQGPSRRG